MRRRFRVIALLMALSMTLPTQGSVSVSIAKEATVGVDETQSDDSIVAGEALATLVIPGNEDSPLLHEGTLKNDPRLRVCRVMCFDSAEQLAKSTFQKKSFAKKLFYVVHVKSSLSTDALMEVLAKYDHVTEVSPNRKHKLASLDDPYFSEQWALGGENYYNSHTNTVPGSSIGYSPEETKSEKAPIVAVIDNGVDYTHEDLKNRMWVNPYKSLPGVYGYDCCNDDPDVMPATADDHHATMVAGIIAAETGNGVGIAGVSRQAEIMSVQIFDSTNEDMSGTDAAELAGFEYIYKAMKLGANVVAVNCSYGTEPSYVRNEISDTIPTYDAVLRKLGIMGTLVVFSSGNEGADLDKMPYGYPTELDPTYTMVVGSSTYKGEASSFSNYGSRVDLMAPGEQILTTINYNKFNPDVYDVEKRAKLCRVYDDFNSNPKPFKTCSDILDGEKSAVTVTVSDEDFYAEKSGHSMAVYFERTRSRDPDAYLLFYDITNYDIDPNEEFYVTYDYKMSYEGDLEWNPNSEENKFSASKEFGIFSLSGRTYLVLDMRARFESLAGLIGETMYIDNLAISKSNPDETEFGKYMYISGTSFSAPCVAGAVARLASLFPDDNPLTRKEKILSTAKRFDALKGKCSSGAMLDMSDFSTTQDIHVDPIAYKVTKIKLNKSKATLKVGKKLKLKATVTPNYATNKEITWKVSNSKYASVSSSGVVKAKKKGKGYTVTVTAKAKDGSGKKATCKVKIKK